MKKFIFEGVGTAIITPFKNHSIDIDRFKLILTKQLESNIDAIIVLGTTGEPSTLTLDERQIIIETAVKMCKGKSKVVVGAGSNSTEQAVKYVKQAEQLGADGLLIVTPYYNKCTQNGLVLHYKRIAEKTCLPIIVYNVPSRTGVNILPETMAKLCDIDNICGIKEASGNISQFLDYYNTFGNKVAIYSGEDQLNAILLIYGAKGVISVASNIVPKIIKKITMLVEDGNISKAIYLQNKTHLLCKSLFLEVNPIPVKRAMNYLGLCDNELRLPLSPMDENKFTELKFQIDIAFGIEYDNL